MAGDVLGFRCVSAGNWILVSTARVPASFASPAFTGTALYNGIEIGFRGIPITVSNANYTFVAADKGKCRAKTTTAAYTYTVPASVFTAGDALTIRNSGTAGNITIAQGAGFTLGLGGTTTTGSRTLAPGGLCTILFDSATAGVATGAGVS